MPNRKTINALRAGAVVGTIHSPGSLAAARELSVGAVDFLELRVDAFAAEPGQKSRLARLKQAVASLPAPLIVTVRDAREGGAVPLSAGARRALFRDFMEHAALVDVELRWAARFSDLLQEAREGGAGVVLSHHDFRTTPPLERLEELARRAGDAGAAVFKVAATAGTAQALSVLLQFLSARGGGRRPELAVMGMGKFGKISRLALGGAGSVLNYGYLHKLQVPGQWPAEQLKQRLSELFESEGA